MFANEDMLVTSDDSVVIEYIIDLSIWCTIWCSMER